MTKQELIELTSKLYKITLLFPKKEPLRYKIRERADQVLANFVYRESLKDSNPGSLALNWGKRYKEIVFLIERDLEILNGFFEIAKWQNWVSYFDILEIQEKYDRIKCYFKNEAGDFCLEEKSLKMEFPLPLKVSRGRASTEVQNRGSLDSRKEKILNILKEKGKVQVWEAKEFFPEVSKRTLRRDFEKLLKQGVIERMGEKNNTFYCLKSQES